jgi:hypothetical protein
MTDNTINYEYGTGGFTLTNDPNDQTNINNPANQLLHLQQLVNDATNTSLQIV